MYPRDVEGLLAALYHASCVRSTFFLFTLAPFCILLTCWIYAPNRPLQDITLPLSFPLKTSSSSPSSEGARSLFVPKGTTLVLGLAQSNLRKEVWGPDAGIWNPARWLRSSSESDSGQDSGVELNSGKDRNKDGKREERYPGVWAGIMSFLGGPRGCIGVRYSLMEIRACFYSAARILLFLVDLG